MESRQIDFAYFIFAETITESFFSATSIKVYMRFKDH